MSRVQFPYTQLALAPSSLLGYLQGIHTKKLAFCRLNQMQETGKGLLLKAEPIAAAFRNEVQQSLTKATRRPRLVGILATSSAPSKFYAEFTKKQCEDLGVDFVLKTTGAADTGDLGEGEGVEEAIIEANEDENVDGIMVYYPIFGGQQDHYLQQVVSPYKDVEGLHFKFHYNLYHNIRFIEPQSLVSSGVPSATSAGVLESEEPPPGTVKSIIPCTPLAIVKCLEHVGVYNKILPYGDRAYGRTITVINRSEVVGRPLAALLANDGARVFSVDIDSVQEYTKRPVVAAARRYHPRHVVHPSTNTLQECLAISDVVVSAVPTASYKVKTQWLKDGCVCLNVAADKNFEKDVREKASLYIPAVGKVTILMLLRNLLRLQQYKAVE
ncbi:NAD(P)-binding protein [Mycena metata]|uniref:NAD(P)-binding protein n=1 Tax=Mycena metata TaxID=1033252 RepID=A0AAD7J7A8_9AGAR|nr:NAD(P)-binding protein [Mycena metata]